MGRKGGDFDPPHWGVSSQMGELEATMWRAGSHPENSTQGAVIEVLDGVPDWETVRRLHIDGLELYPRFRQRVVEPAVPVGPPVWVDDQSFDLDRHLRRYRLPEPGTYRQLLDKAAELAMEELDSEKPPWSATFIDGVEGGRAAYVLVVHHCLMDGHASVQLLSELHGKPDPAEPGRYASQPRSSLRVAAEQLFAKLLDAPSFAGGLVGGVLGALRSGPLNAARYTASVGRVLAPPASGSSELLAKGTRKHWRYDVLDVALADLKAAGRSVGATINDAYVSGIIAGLRIYHEKHGFDIGDITLNMPVSLRRAEDPQGGNRFVTAFIKAPSSIVEPATRMRRFRQIVGNVSAEPALDIFGLLLPVVNRAPTAVLRPLFNSMQDRTDLTISNVPGMTSQVRFGGVPVVGVYYFAPLPGCPISTVLFSYNGNCHIGVTYDEEVFGDNDELASCLRAGMDEVLDLRFEEGSILDPDD